jgi:lysophospholipase L1-like esterase
MKTIHRLTCGIFATVILTAGSATLQAQTSYKFDFSGGPPAAGWIAIAPTNFYSTEAGYGYERGANVSIAGNATASARPFYFSAKLPEGNYQVTVTLGGSAESTTTIKAELRRLMLEKIHTDAGKMDKRSFIVNLRVPAIAGGGEVHLKDREKTSELRDWDEKLTLEFNGDHPSIAKMEIEKVDVPTVFVLGDSTVCDQPTEPWNSWGQMLPRFFKPEVAVANHSESGESVASSLHALRFEKVFSLMKPGDYFFVQFGHNDQKEKNPDSHEIYRANLIKIVAETRAKGGTPVLVTSMERKGGVEHDTLAGYPDIVRQVATSEKCALIDLNAMSRIFYQALGPDIAKAFALTDGTHHDNYGSYELAQCIVVGIQQDKLPLAAYIVDDFKGFDPAHPDPVADFQMAVSPNYSGLKPLGN